MKIMNLTERNEDAVSPVIGVMLMLVVTIVIAAVVAAFAGGLGSDVEMAPTAALDIDVFSNGKVKIEHLSGETLTNEKITIKVTDANGNPKGTGNLGTQGVFTPGSTKEITLTGASIGLGDYVTVTILADGKHIVAKKDVLVTA